MKEESINFMQHSHQAREAREGKNRNQKTAATQKTGNKNTPPDGSTGSLPSRDKYTK